MFSIQLGWNQDVGARQSLFRHALFINKWPKTKPTFWGPVEKKMSTSQSCENYLFTKIIISTLGTDHWGPELKLKQLKYSLNAYL